MAVVKTQKEEEDGNGSVSQFNDLELTRQSIPQLRFKLPAPASLAMTLTGNAKLVTLI